MFDTLLIAERMQDQTLAQAWAWYIGYHSYPRPLRVLEWWLAAQAFGTRVWLYEVVNSIAMMLFVWTATQKIAEVLGLSSNRAWLTGLMLTVSYPAAYGFLHYPFALNLALGLWGLYFALRGRSWGVALIVLAALGHETNLLFAAVVVLYHMDKVVLPRAWWCALAVTSVGITLLMLLLVAHRASYTMPISEHIGRVLVPAVTGGLAIESFRFVGPAYMRVREFLGTPGALVYVVAALPTLGALWRVRSWFLWSWVLLGVGALLLPVGTPESYHLLVVLPALYMLWARLSWRWVPVVLVVALLHVIARVNLAGDVGAMKATVEVIRERLANGTGGEIIGAPILIGGHWAYLPAMASRGTCLREPTWRWSRDDGFTPSPLIRIERLAANLDSLCRFIPLLDCGPRRDARQDKCPYRDPAIDATLASLLCVVSLVCLKRTVNSVCKSPERFIAIPSYFVVGWLALFLGAGLFADCVYQGGQQRVSSISLPDEDHRLMDRRDMGRVGDGRLEMCRD